MRKTLLSLSACSLAFAAPVAIPTAASAYPARDAVALCRQILLDDPGFYKSLGDCINSASTFCNDLKKAGILELYFKNMGECVNWAKSTAS